MTKRAFLAFPFKEESSAAINLIEQVAKRLHLDIINPQSEAFSGSITSFIRDSISSSDTVIAVVTEENGNVYYEIGLAHCQRKPVVLLTTDISTLRFDLQDQRAIVFDPSNPGGRLKNYPKCWSMHSNRKMPKTLYCPPFTDCQGPLKSGINCFKWS